MMKRAGMRRKGGDGEDVQAMEEKLAQLKMQMEVERQRRAELLSKSGSRGSIWRSGKEGALRGAGVREAVKGKHRERIMRPTSSDASREETPTEDDEKQSSYLHDGLGGGVHEGGQSRPRQPFPDHDCGRPPSPPSSPEPEGDLAATGRGTVVAGDVLRTVRPRGGAQPGGKEAPIPATVPMAMECQTEAPPVREWKINVSRPQSARSMTYMEKMLAERRKAGGATPR